MGKYEEKDNWKYVDKNYLNMDTYRKFKSFCESKYSIIKPKIEALIPNFIEVYLECPSDSEAKKYIKDNINITLSIKVKDEYASKLLGIDKSEDSRFGKIVAKIKDSDKQKIIKLYNDVISWINNPKQITGKMDLNFDDIVSVCKRKLAKDMNIQNLTTIMSKNKNNFNTVDAKTFISDEFDEKYIKSKLGNDIRLIQDYHSGSGDYIVLAKNNLYWINLEHNELESNMSYLPFGSIFDDYDDKILRYILNIN